MVREAQEQFDNAFFWDARLVGQSFSSVEHITTDDKLHCLWYRSRLACDFMVWNDENGVRIRQQFQFAGSCVDWDIIRGTRTGFILDCDFTKQPLNILARHRFDDQIHMSFLGYTLDALKSMSIISEHKQEQSCRLFQESLTYDDLVAKEEISAQSNSWFKAVAKLISQN